MILDCMLGAGFGGLEQVFLDQLEMLPAAELNVRGVARRGGIAAARARAAGLPCDELVLLSSWDPVTLARARALITRHNPELILCHGRRAHKLIARAVGHHRPIVVMVHTPRFD